MWAAEEAKGNGFAIQVPAKAGDMRLYGDVAAVVHGRTGADVDDGLAERAVGQDYIGGIYTGRGDGQTAAAVHIGRGESEFMAEMAAMHHGTCQHVRTAEHTGCLLHAAPGQRVAHKGAAHAGKQGGLLHGYAFIAAKTEIVLHPERAAIASEGVVVAHHHLPDTGAVHTAEPFGGGEPPQRFVESEADHLHAKRGKGRVAVVGRHQQFRSALRSYHLQRMAVESDHCGRETEGRAPLLHEIQHLPVSLMDTVESTGGDYFPVFLH